MFCLLVSDIITLALSLSLALAHLEGFPVYDGVSVCVCEAFLADECGGSDGSVLSSFESCLVVGPFQPVSVSYFVSTVAADANSVVADAVDAAAMGRVSLASEFWTLFAFCECFENGCSSPLLAIPGLLPRVTDLGGWFPVFWLSGVVLCHTGG